MRHLRKYANYACFFEDAAAIAGCLERVAARATKLPDGCVVLPAHKDGYTRISFAGMSWQGHRLLWIIAHGDIGSLVIDHKCRNKACVNLAHLEPVTNRENVMRGKAKAKISSRGVCAKGHRTSVYAGRTVCPECKNEWYRERYRSDPDFREREKEKRRRRYAAA